MKRIQLVAHQSDEADILKALQAIDAVEIIASEAASADSPALAAAQERVQKLSAALSAMKPYASKKGLLSARPEQSLGTLKHALPQALSAGESVEADARELMRIKSDIEKNESITESLLPWLDFPADMQRFSQSRSVRYFAGRSSPAVGRRPNPSPPF
ncbi:MAG: hypothetical protein Q4C13_06535 [Clostridia bacterium]|nr:hypothetical protein [Clostridia bacterium]